MANVTLQIPMDERLFAKFDHLCEELGLDATTAITMFAKTMVRQQRIPFTVSLRTPQDDGEEAPTQVQKQHSLPEPENIYADLGMSITDMLV